MYEAFFGLRERPFSLTPDPAFLYVGGVHRHAMVLLQYALSQGAGFAVVTGEVGSGKTTLIRRVAADSGPHLVLALLTNVHRGNGPLLPWIAQALGIGLGHRSAADDYGEFEEYLLREYALGRRVVVIVDEAQNLSPRTLEELRVLSNINSGKDFLLQTVLVGQPELRVTLRRPELRQFAQRIAIDYHIGPLNREETGHYIAHRLAVAGGAPDLIHADAVPRLYARTGGTPRLINLICDMALVYAYAEQRRLVDAEIVDAVLADRDGGGVLPLVNVEVVQAASR